MDSFLVIAVPIASMPSGPTMEPFSQRLEVTEATQRGINDGTVGSAPARKNKSASRPTVARLISKAQRGPRDDTLTISYEALRPSETCSDRHPAGLG
jgi:hypothetical protein